MALRFRAWVLVAAYARKPRENLVLPFDMREHGPEERLRLADDDAEANSDLKALNPERGIDGAQVIGVGSHHGPASLPRE